MKTTFRHIGTALLVAATPLMAGLAEDSSAQRAAQAEAKMEAFRFEVGVMRAQISSILRQLQLLQKDGTDLRAAFAKYLADLDTMDILVKQTADRADQMKTNAEAFFLSWEQQVASIQNEEVRQIAKDRYERRRKSYSKISTSMDETRKALVPYVSLLKDTKKLLEIELSPGSIKSAKKIIAEATWKGADIEEELYNVLVELDRLARELGRYK
jgi:replication initiation and membrane attachment protein DnaB